MGRWRRGEVGVCDRKSYQTPLLVFLKDGLHNVTKKAARGADRVCCLKVDAALEGYLQYLLSLLDQHGCKYSYMRDEVLC